MILKCAEDRGAPTAAGLLLSRWHEFAQEHRPSCALRDTSTSPNGERGTGPRPTHSDPHGETEERTGKVIVMVMASRQRAVSIDVEWAHGSISVSPHGTHEQADGAEGDQGDTLTGKKASEPIAPLSFEATTRQVDRGEGQQADRTKAIRSKDETSSPRRRPANRSRQCHSRQPRDKLTEEKASKPIAPMPFEATTRQVDRGEGQQTDRTNAIRSNDDTS